ncbi:unnamed protein product [Rotaria socialis]|uniref:Acetylserotonin O-methyltransferase n=3 Tax=Rotaria socialis TaxID=392032 RepID=A0A818WRZ3_9BILA|nr:unnamed protein product [Rotaria socialis]CAF4566185.1 unnamed protein product [Rotaria socialis]
MVSKSIQREPSTYLVSAGDEPNQILKPIKGFATEPLVSLEEACQPLLGIIRRLKHYAHDAKNLTQDESAAIRLYTMQWDSKLGGPHVSLYSHLNCILRQPDGKVLKPWFFYAFLGTTGKRSIFSIEIFDGRSVKDQSNFTEEDEVLLLPDDTSTHKIVPGDTFRLLTQKYGYTLDEIIAANQDIDLLKLRVDQLVQLPSACRKPKTKITLDEHRSDQVCHTVFAGDTCERISEWYGCTIEDIMIANPDIQPTSIYPGQILRLPRTYRTANNTRDRKHTPESTIVDFIMADQEKYVILSPLVIGGLPKYMSFVFHRCMERAVWTFAELGIADLMAAHKVSLTATELSQLNGNDWNAEFVYRLLRAVADADIVKELSVSDLNSQSDICPERVNHFQLTDNGLFLTSNHPSKARDLVRLDLGPIAHRASEYQPRLIQHGTKYGNSFEQAFQCGLFDYLGKEENKEYSTIFNNAMISYSNDCIQSICPPVDFSHFEKLVDIAGGFGSLLAFLLEKHPKLNGIVFDLAHVIKDAQEQHPNEFQQRNIEPNRYQFVSGDMFKPETIPQADSYVLKFIIHDWNDEDAVMILKNILSANKSGPSRSITVFIVEMVILPNERQNWVARIMDIEMLSVLNAKERTTAEYMKLLKESGYELKKLHRINESYSIIEAIATTVTSN